MRQSNDIDDAVNDVVMVDVNGQKKETFYILYIYAYVNLQVLPGVLAAMSGSFGVPPACST